MKSKEEIINNYEKYSTDLDDRFGTRFAYFLTKEEAKKLNIFTDEAIDEWNDSDVIPWTEENIINQLKKDVAFGFEKGLDQRGISSSLMFEVVKTWNKILENELSDFNECKYYGLPLFKETAVLYGFDNPIGDDYGDEFKYGM